MNNKDLDIQTKDILEMTQKLVNLREMESFYKRVLQQFELDEKRKQETETEMIENFPFLFECIQEQSVKPEEMLSYKPEEKKMEPSTFYRLLCKFSFLAYVYSFFGNHVVIIDNQDHSYKR